LKDVELFSITVVGSSGCGKTALINSFVNNVFLQAGEPTDDPRLYYRTLSLNKSRSTNASQDEADRLPIVAEIEDTFAFSRKDGASPHGDSLLPRNAERFLELQTTNYKNARGEALELMGGYTAPVDGKYSPFARRRMGFMIVFDGTDQNSLKEAVQAHFKLKEKMKNVEEKLQPVIYFVANMADKDPTCPDYQKRVQAAKHHAETNHTVFVEVTASSLIEVKRLFRSILTDIVLKPSLWRHDPRLPANEEIIEEDFDAQDFSESDSGGEGGGGSGKTAADLLPHEHFLLTVEQHRQKLVKDTEDCAVQ